MRADRREAGRAGTPTIRDVAERAGVSTATVSRILSGADPVLPATRARVLDAVEALGYRPSGIARSLKRRTTQTIGLIVTDIANPFYPAVVRAVEDAARDHDLALVLCNGAEDADREASYLELLAERRVDGIIVASSGLTERHARWLRAAPVAVALVNCEAPGTGLPAILSDNRAGAAAQVGHLVELGHRRIAHVAGPPTSAASTERLAGVRDGLAAAGLDARRPRIAQGDGHVGGGEQAMAELLDRPDRPTGVVAFNDLTAAGALRACRRRGLRVPDDVSVVGFDDIDLAAYLDPPLTTAAQQVELMGRWAVERVVGQLSGDEPGPADGPTGDDRVVRLPVSLRVRASSGPPGVPVPASVEGARR